MPAKRNDPSMKSGDAVKEGTEAAEKAVEAGADAASETAKTAGENARSAERATEKAAEKAKDAAAEMARDAGNVAERSAEEGAKATRKVTHDAAETTEESAEQTASAVEEGAKVTASAARQGAEQGKKKAEALAHRTQADLSRMSEMGETSILAVAQLHAQFMRNALQVNARLLDFARERLSEDIRTSEELASCRKFDETVEVMTGFYQRAVEAYTAEAGNLMHVGAEAGRQSTEASMRRFQDQRAS